MQVKEVKYILFPKKQWLYQTYKRKVEEGEKWNGVEA